MNTRLYDLLAYLGLEDRIIDYNVKIEPKKIPQGQWEIAEERVRRFRDKSINFLKNALNQ